MAATRLSDSQKNSLVDRYRAGEGTQELAEEFGCSPNTVIRAVKALLEPLEYERLKQRGRRTHRPAGEEVEPAGEAVDEPAGAPLRDAMGVNEGRQPAHEDGSDSSAPATIDGPGLAAPSTSGRGDDEGPSVLAIDDADDFSADEEEDDLLADEDVGEDDASAFTPIPPLLSVDDHALSQPVPLDAAQLPASAYMLVDKTVELQARALSEFPELGRLPPEEKDRHALVMFVNPRQAKRQCGRSQRVIKIPDPRILERTAPYLIAQGISRVVIEGALYSLPGS